MQKRRTDFTEGSILRQLIVFILPVMATTALQQLFNTADMVIVRMSQNKTIDCIDTAIVQVGSHRCSRFDRAGIHKNRRIRSAYQRAIGLADVYKMNIDLPGGRCTMLSAPASR